MSTAANFNSGYLHADLGYRVQKIENYRIVTGSVPISDYAMYATDLVRTP
jgi:hypothetical protein